MESASLADIRPFRDKIDTLIGLIERDTRANEETTTLQRRIANSNDDVVEMIKDFIDGEKERRKDEERDERYEQRMAAKLAEAMKRIDQAAAGQKP